MTTMYKDGYTASNISATTAAFTLIGGKYACAVKATWNGGSVKLQVLGPDGSTYLDTKAPFEKADGTGGTEDDLVITTFLADGQKIFDLPAGSYRLTVATATAIYANINRIS